MPDTWKDWLEVGTERASDARSLKDQERSVAAVYMAGYAVECKLKALIRCMNRKPPTSGPRGHDLRGLWEAAGFRVNDIGGYKRLFLQNWNTDLRYQNNLPNGTDCDSLYKGAQELAGFIQKKIRNRKGIS